MPAIYLDLTLEFLTITLTFQDRQPSLGVSETTECALPANSGFLNMLFINSQIYGCHLGKDDLFIQTPCKQFVLHLHNAFKRVIFDYLKCIWQMVYIEETPLALVRKEEFEDLFFHYISIN